MKRDFYRSLAFQDVHKENARAFRQEVTKRMSSIKDLWDVDTLAYKEFERMFERHLLDFFGVLDRFEE
eukprot:13430019-Alexandrium_andersonii.AAC.1